MSRTVKYATFMVSYCELSEQSTSIIHTQVILNSYCHMGAYPRYMRWNRSSLVLTLIYSPRSQASASQQDLMLRAVNIFPRHNVGRVESRLSRSKVTGYIWGQILLVTLTHVRSQRSAWENLMNVGNPPWPPDYHSCLWANPKGILLYQRGSM